MQKQNLNLHLKPTYANIYETFLFLKENTKFNLKAKTVHNVKQQLTFPFTS